MQKSIEKAAQIIRDADALIIAAGAGMGVDSGLPDFRGTQGFWQAYPGLARSKMEFSEIASPLNFETRPKLAWGFYGHRLQLYRDTVPHAGFALLKKWAAVKRGGSFVFTSNVDGQFQKAGFDSQQVEECHGSIHHTQCLHNCCDSIWPAGDLRPVIDTEQCFWQGELPRCHCCKAILRPNILMFNDWGWIDLRTQLQHKRRLAWIQQLRRQQLRPVVIELGAGTAIPSVRHFAQGIRKQFKEVGARLIRINPRDSVVSGSHDVGLDIGALAGLQAIEQVLQQGG